MSFLHQFQNFSTNSKINRRQALLGFSILTLSACSRAGETTKPADTGVAYYTCTMHPFVRSQDPKGTCPVCGMALVPVMKSGATATTQPSAVPDAAAAVVASNGRVSIAPERLQEIGVTYETVAKRALTRSLNAPGRVTVDESGMRDINVKAGAGYVEKLYANYEGASVHKGEPLMRVLVAGWLDAQIDFIKSYRAWKRTPTMSPNNSFALGNKLELMRARIRVYDLSESQIADLEKFALSTDEADLRTGHGLSGSFDVLSPFDGHVHTKKVLEGMRFEAGQSLLELENDEHVWIVADFPESQGGQLDLGQKMTVSFPSLPQLKMPAQIDFINPIVDEQSRRLRVRLVLLNPHHSLHLGLFAQVTGEIAMGQRLCVSSDAVVPTGDRFIVFVDHGGGQLEPREVSLGDHASGYDEILSGLQEGDRVVASANFLIDAESRIQGVLKTWGDRP